MQLHIIIVQLVLISVTAFPSHAAAQLYYIALFSLISSLLSPHVALAIMYLQYTEIAS